MWEDLLQKKAAAEQWPLIHAQMEQRQAEFSRARQQREEALRQKGRAESELEYQKRGLALTQKKKEQRAQAEAAYQNALAGYQAANARQSQTRERLDAAVRQDREAWRNVQDYQQYMEWLASTLEGQMDEKSQRIYAAAYNITILRQGLEQMSSARRRLEMALAATGGPEPDYSGGSALTAGERVATGAAWAMFGLLGAGVVGGIIAVSKDRNSGRSNLDNVIASAQHAKEEALQAGQEISIARQFYDDGSGRMLQIGRAIENLKVQSFMRGPNSEATGYRISEILTEIYEMQMEIAGYLDQESTEMERLILEKLEERRV